MGYPKTGWASTPVELEEITGADSGPRLKFASAGILRLSTLKLAAELPINE
jgi:hypothetical protein